MSANSDSSSLDNPFPQPVTEMIQEFARLMANNHLAAKRVHPEVLEYLLKRGWCHSYHFTDKGILYLGHLVAKLDGDKVDEAMAEFTRGRFNEILRIACEKYPSRAQILVDAFDAHSNGKYTLSVPTLLPQIDGIGCDVLGVDRQFFLDKTRQRGLDKTVADFKWPWGDQPYTLGGIDEMMLRALTLSWSMTLDTEERNRKGMFSPLNRHGVLHGRDTDYYTEFNSLRCILLLGYLLEVREVLREQIPEHLAQLEKITGN